MICLCQLDYYFSTIETMQPLLDKHKVTFFISF